MKKNLLFVLIIPYLIYCNDLGIRFAHLTAQDGLSHSWIVTILKDKYGYMWFGTENNGINKYDGYKFTIYKNDPNDKRTISDNGINVIYEDKKGILWVGTKRGLNKYNRELDRFIPVNSFIDDYVQGIYEREDGNFYITTIYNFAIYYPEKDSFSLLISEDQKLPYVFIKKGIIQYEKNKFLVATRAGLLSLDATTNQFTVVKKDIDIRSIYKDTKGRIWIGTEKDGLFCMTYDKKNPKKFVFKNYNHQNNNEYSLSPGAIVTIEEDNNEFLWIGTEKDGLNLMNLKIFEKNNYPIFHHYRNIPYDNSSLSNNGITSIYKDNEGTMWIGAYNGGVNYYSKLLYKFQHIKSIPNNPNSLSDNNVNVIYEEEDRLWVGTQKGVDIFDKRNNKWEHLFYEERNPNSLSPGAVWAILRDKHNNIWIGTWGGGLSILNEKKKTFTHYLHNEKDENSLSKNNIFGITEDKEGNLWIATMGGGLDKFDYKSKSFKHYKSNPDDPKSLTNNWVKMVIETHSGELWVATTAGVNVFNKEKEVFTHFIHNREDPRSISSDAIVIIFEDSKHNIWVGTENGLNLFNPDSNNFILYNEEDGLPNNVIRGICEDNKGNLWVSTNKGLSKFINAINRPKKPIFENYDVSDGLQGNEFNSRACLRGKDGRLFFGGNNGLTIFHPDSIKRNHFVPPVVITNILLFNKEVPIGREDSPLKKHISLLKEIVLSYKNSVITLEYAALNFLAPEKNQYAFMLEGFDEDWNYVGNKREVTYTNLAPGTYTFRVKGSNNDGVWNEEGTSLKIIITPPFWKTVWFRLIILIFIGGFIHFIFWIRVKRIVAYGRELEKKVAERTKELESFAYIVSHDLKAPLRSINQLSEWIIEDYYEKLDEKGKENLKLLKDRTLRMNNMIQGILEYSRIGRTEGEVEKVDLNSLVKETIEILSPPKNIKIKIENKLPIYMADRTRLIQIFQNLLSNAIKYIDKPKGIIKIGCTEEKNYWKFSISDNGPGIDKKYHEKIFEIFQTLGNKKEESTGIGLTIVKKIVELYKGKIWVESKLGKGTTFFFTLPKQ
ncbi:MAG: two-component regulator propeller domain-containing protein [candidate division WOR-3 bacterium]